MSDEDILCGVCGGPVLLEDRERGEELLGAIPATLLLHWLCPGCADEDLVDEEGERVAQWITVS